MSTIKFSFDSRTLFGGTDKGDIKIWNATSLDLLRSMPTAIESPAGSGGSIRTVAVAPNGRTIATTNMYSGIRLWNAADGRLVKVLSTGRNADGYPIDSYPVAFSADGKLIAAGNPLQRWRLVEHAATPSNFQKLPSGPWQWPVNIEFSSDAKLLAVGNFQGEVAMQEAVSGKTLWKSLPPDISQLAPVSRPDDRSLVFDSGPPGDETYYFPLAFVPRHNLLVYANLNGVFECDSRTGKTVRTYIRRSTMTFALRCSPDGKTVAVSTVKGLELWDRQSGKITEFFPVGRVGGYSYCLDFSPDGKLLAAGGSRVVRLWELQ